MGLERLVLHEKGYDIHRSGIIIMEESCYF